MRFFRTSYLVVSVLIFYSCRVQKIVVVERSVNWAQRAELQGLNNLYKVDADLYRSEQPGKNDMVLLEKFGIKTVLNVRNIRNDNYEAKYTNLQLQHLPINTWTISYAEVLQSMRAIEKSPKPVLIHCKHGSDRTGCIVAVYRMSKCGWTKEAALAEFRDGGFGFHEKWFPNILRLLNSLDVEQLKKDLKKT
jgi:protein tyrosine phosphatase (PTP) superfamily phosphohydrolase (DUF442 family)